ncbi:MAG: tRNA(Ile)-lysidine synthase [Sphingomonadales bacterium]|jgi:tRNA(Ile)-lysidine synthase|nr:tRNA(Ile)-lysidine synthase [Sphingomonadales bacterium]
MPPDLPPDLVERFRADLRVLAPGGEKLAIAVSGGPDSLALLLLAAAAFPGRAAAATVDHGLRPEAAGEAALVARICAGLGVPHRTLRVTLAPGGSVQARARQARYAALGTWMAEEGLALLLTGHHADDQAETLLMRLVRGSGLAGLAGIRARARIGGLDVCRPLLGWRRSALGGIVRAAGLRPVDDPSNADEAHDRVRMRRRLAEAPWLDAAALARSAAALAEAEEALDWTAARLAAERVTRQGGTWLLDPADLPDELLRRLVLFCLRGLDPGASPRGEQVTCLVETLAAGGKASLGRLLCSGGPSYRFEPAPARRQG